MKPLGIDCFLRPGEIGDLGDVGDTIALRVGELGMSDAVS